MKHKQSDRTKELERRRLKAGSFFVQGKSQVWVSKHFSVSRPAVWAWYWAWNGHGMKGLMSKGRSGAPPKLSRKQLKKVESELLKGPKAQGYSTELWTLERIAKLIKKTTRVTYHRGHVWRLLQDLGWSSQKPETRARERDEKKIKQWMRKDFPRIQKKGSEREPS